MQIVLSFVFKKRFSKYLLTDREQAQFIRCLLYGQTSARGNSLDVACSGVVAAILLAN